MRRRRDDPAGRPTWHVVVTRVAIAAAGAVASVVLAGTVHEPIGPFETTLSLRPSLRSDTTVRLGPLGTIRLDTHDAPLAIDARIDELRLDAAEAISKDPSRLNGLNRRVGEDARDAVRHLFLRAGIVAIVGGALAASLLHRRIVATLTGAAVAATLTAAMFLAMTLTWRVESLAEPRYTGLLTIAPRAVGDVQAVVDRFDEYGAQLAHLVENVTDLYRATASLPVAPSSDSIRALHVSDIHLNPQAFDLMESMIERLDIDLVIDSGDLTDWGSEPERHLVDRIGSLGVPYVWVRGNHDSRATQDQVAAQPNAVVLDGDEVREVAGLRLWGIGSPRHTADKRDEQSVDEQREDARRFARVVAEELRAATADEDADVLVVHDPRATVASGDLVPLILSGHTHKAKRDDVKGAVRLVQGSTGGAGLRALEGPDPEPLALSVLFFERRTARLIAYDQVTVSGLGGTGASIERHVVAPRDEDEERPVDGGPDTSEEQSEAPSDDR